MGTRAWWRWMAVGLLALSCLAATPAPGRACSCADIAMTGEAVFIGHVVTVIPREWLQWLFLRPNLLRRHDLASLAVDNMWHGAARRFFLVCSGDEVNCQIPFEPGKSYLVDGRYTRAGVLDASFCGGTRLMT